MVNDGVRNMMNCKMQAVSGRLCLFATKNIDRGSELRYDYGVTNLPWRKVSCNT